MNLATLNATLIPILIALAGLIIVILAIMVASRRLQSQRLRKRFGPEYDYTLKKLGSSRKVEQTLKERQARVTQLNIHPLPDNQIDRYNEEWIDIQADFVDNPNQSVEKGNRLVTEVMIAQGFPVADFEQRAEDLSVMYPNFVPIYREANEIMLKSRNDGISTEELRQAMVDYHSLFEQLLKNNPRIEKVKAK